MGSLGPLLLVILPLLVGGQQPLVVPPGATYIIDSPSGSPPHVKPVSVVLPDGSVHQQSQPEIVAYTVKENESLDNLINRIFFSPSDSVKRDISPPSSYVQPTSQSGYAEPEAVLPPLEPTYKEPEGYPRQNAYTELQGNGQNVAPDTIVIVPRRRGYETAPSYAQPGYPSGYQDPRGPGYQQPGFPNTPEGYEPNAPGGSNKLCPLKNCRDPTNCPLAPCDPTLPEPVVPITPNQPPPAIWLPPHPSSYHEHQNPNPSVPGYHENPNPTFPGYHENPNPIFPGYHENPQTPTFPNPSVPGYHENPNPSFPGYHEIPSNPTFPNPPVPGYHEHPVPGFPSDPRTPISPSFPSSNIPPTRPEFHEIDPRLPPPSVQFPSQTFVPVEPRVPVDPRVPVPQQVVQSVPPVIGPPIGVPQPGWIPRVRTDWYYAPPRIVGFTRVPLFITPQPTTTTTTAPYIPYTFWTQPPPPEATTTITTTPSLPQPDPPHFKHLVTFTPRLPQPDPHYFTRDETTTRTTTLPPLPPLDPTTPQTQVPPAPLVPTTTTSTTTSTTTTTTTTPPPTTTTTEREREIEIVYVYPPQPPKPVFTRKTTRTTTTTSTTTTARPTTTTTKRHQSPNPVFTTSTTTTTTTTSNPRTRLPSQTTTTRSIKPLDPGDPEMTTTSPTRTSFPPGAWPPIPGFEDGTAYPPPPPLYQTTRRPQGISHGGPTPPPAQLAIETTTSPWLTTLIVRLPTVPEWDPPVAVNSGGPQTTTTTTSAQHASLPSHPGTTTTMRAVDPRVSTTTGPEDPVTTATTGSDASGTDTRNRPGMTTSMLPPLAPWNPVPDHGGPRPPTFPSEHRNPSFPHSHPHGEATAKDTTTIGPHSSFPPGAWPHNPRISESGTAYPREPPYRTTTTSADPSEDWPRYPVVPEHGSGRPAGRPFGPSTTYSPKQATFPLRPSPSLHPNEIPHTSSEPPARVSFPPGFGPWNPLVPDHFSAYPRPAPDDREWPTEPWEPNERLVPERWHLEGPEERSKLSFIPGRGAQVYEAAPHGTSTEHPVSHHHHTDTPRTRPTPPPRRVAIDTTTRPWLTTLTFTLPPVPEWDPPVVVNQGGPQTTKRPTTTTALRTTTTTTVTPPTYRPRPRPTEPLTYPTEPPPTTTTTTRRATTTRPTTVKWKPRYTTTTRPTTTTTVTYPTPPTYRTTTTQGSYYTPPPAYETTTTVSYPEETTTNGYYHAYPAPSYPSNPPPRTRYYPSPALPAPYDAYSARPYPPTTTPKPPPAYPESYHKYGQPDRAQGGPPESPDWVDGIHRPAIPHDEEEKTYSSPPPYMYRPGEFDQLTSTTARPEPAWTRGYSGNMIDIIGPLILPDEPDPLLGYVTKEELEKAVKENKLPKESFGEPSDVIDDASLPPGAGYKYILNQIRARAAAFVQKLYSAAALRQRLKAA